MSIIKSIYTPISRSLVKRTEKHGNKIKEYFQNVNSQGDVQSLFQDIESCKQNPSDGLYEKIITNYSKLEVSKYLGYHRSGHKHILEIIPLTRETFKENEISIIEKRLKFFLSLYQGIISRNKDVLENRELSESIIIKQQKDVQNCIDFIGQEKYIPNSAKELIENALNCCLGWQKLCCEKHIPLEKYELNFSSVTAHPFFDSLSEDLKENIAFSSINTENFKHLKLKFEEESNKNFIPNKEDFKNKHVIKYVQVVQHYTFNIKEHKSEEDAKIADQETIRDMTETRLGFDIQEYDKLSVEEKTQFNNLYSIFTWVNLVKSTSINSLKNPEKTKEFNDRISKSSLSNAYKYYSLINYKKYYPFVCFSARVFDLFYKYNNKEEELS